MDGFYVDVDDYDPTRYCVYGEASGYAFSSHPTWEDAFAACNTLNEWLPTLVVRLQKFEESATLPQRHTSAAESQIRPTQGSQLLPTLEVPLSSVGAVARSGR